MHVATFDCLRILKRKATLYHCLSWAALYLLWVVVFHRYSFSVTRTMTIEFCYLIFITAGYYVISNFIIPHYLFKKKYVWFVATTLLTISLSAWLRALVIR